MNHIYIEAILFVAVFSAMSVISIKISSRQAKKYQEEHQKSTQETKHTVKPLSKKEQRIIELSHLVDKNLLKNSEFQILKENI